MTVTPAGQPVPAPPAGQPVPAPPALTLPLDGARLLRRLEELAQRGALPGGGITRLAYGAAWCAAQALVSDWMREAGLLVRRDAAGNLFGRIEGSRGGRVVLVGSHLDTVRGGGALDGALGIVAAIEALDALARRRGRPNRTVEVVAIADHEGARFGLPALGARAIAGRLEPDEAARARDGDGVTLADALRGIGLDPARLSAAERLDVDVFLELHVEQGSALDEAGEHLAVASGATGASLLEVVVIGRADDAGTPIARRRDALLGAAAIALAVESVGRERDLAVGVGELSIEPGHAGVVPGRARLCIELRGADAARRAEAADEVRAACARAAHERELAFAVRLLRDAAPRTFDPVIGRVLSAACAAAGAPSRGIVAGGVHDAAVLAAVARTGLLLVPSIDGRSHCPEEATAAADVLLGARALALGLETVLFT